MLPIKDRYLKKKCNVAEIHSVTNKGSLFEEQMKYSRRNAMKKKITITNKGSLFEEKMQCRRNSMLAINGHYLKKESNAAEEMQCRSSLCYQ